MKSDQQIWLSEAGNARRESMLIELREDMAMFHRRRRARRRAGAIIVPLALCAVVVWLAYSWNAGNSATTNSGLIATGDKPENSVSPKDDQIETEPIMLVEHVKSDPAIVERYSALSSPQLTTIIDDQQLLDVLSQIDRPTGLVRSEGRVWLTSNVVTDEDRYRDGS